MGTETIISIIGLIVAALAFVFSFLTYFFNRKQTRMETTYKMLYDINMTSFHNPEIAPNINVELTPKQAAYASIVWNFIESVYNLKLHNDRFLKPAISQFVGLYKNWFISNKSSFDIKFQDFIKKRFCI